MFEFKFNFLRKGEGSLPHSQLVLRFGTVGTSLAQAGDGATLQ